MQIIDLLREKGVDTNDVTGGSTPEGSKTSDGVSALGIALSPDSSVLLSAAANAAAAARGDDGDRSDGDKTPEPGDDTASDDGEGGASASSARGPAAVMAVPDTDDIDELVSDETVRIDDMAAARRRFGPGTSLQRVLAPCLLQPQHANDLGA